MARKEVTLFNCVSAKELDKAIPTAQYFQSEEIEESYWEVLAGYELDFEEGWVAIPKYRVVDRLSESE